MAADLQNPTPGSLSRRQLKTYGRMEPKTLGVVQVLIGILTLCLSVSVLMVYELTLYSFIFEIILLLVAVAQLIVSGLILIFSGIWPSLSWVKATLVVHLISLGFTTAAVALLSQHLPYRQDTYHCDHCRQQEIEVAQQHCFKKCTYTVEKNCKYVIDGLLSTLLLFLVIELLICIAAILVGVRILVMGRAQPGAVQPAVGVETLDEVAEAAASQVEVVVAEVAEVELEGPFEGKLTPPMEPQVEPVEVRRLG
ncbi:uncharacterized protein LOC114770325 [Denticeps clupeoides]|uniref:uncharacterized protein LOC114770325 n=1 Tax=Denticeps clupeoides TaxID=299321 RepID=UPI0010A59F91|nr:uncharacterized protein LOC114770325 [Denticeps clupeoides]XP_028819981.1 uncharacterized protein LOC114770325 [Denticeps clupeoides]XP_028819982.1 uncharacterized protein LOC114770325 [Denticeps clupeoides]